MSFDYYIQGRPEFSVLTVQVPENAGLRVEASAMAWMSANMLMKTRVRGGLARTLVGERLFVNEFVAGGGAGELAIAPSAPGDIAHVNLHNQAIFIQNSSFLASALAVQVDTKWQGLVKGFFSGQGLFLIKASGVGDLWFNSYGSLVEIRDPGDGFVVDTSHVVAFTEGLDYSVGTLSGYRSLFFSGEGLVCRFRGSGSLWIQSHKLSAFAWWVRQFRPVKQRRSANNSL